jgi:hypothetical protein
MKGLRTIKTAGALPPYPASFFLQKERSKENGIFCAKRKKSPFFLPTFPFKEKVAGQGAEPFITC